MPEGKLDFMVKEVLRNFPEFSYNICKSKRSSSIYVYIKDNLSYGSIRISDHKNNYDYSFDREIVSDKINLQCLSRAIKNVCLKLRRKRLRVCFNVLERQFAMA